MQVVLSVLYKCVLVWRKSDTIRVPDFMMSFNKKFWRSRSHLETFLLFYYVPESGLKPNPDPEKFENRIWIHTKTPDLDPDPQPWTRWLEGEEWHLVLRHTTRGGRCQVPGQYQFLFFCFIDDPEAFEWLLMYGRFSFRNGGVILFISGQKGPIHI